MKKPLLLAALLCAGYAFTGCHEKKEALTMETVNTVYLEDTDSAEVIIEKAAHVVPTPNQMAALEDEFIAFIHFGPNTFTRREWGTGMEDPKVFDLKTLDTDQWVKTMKDAGMKKVIVTAKHHDGFVIWQSRYTDHGIMSTDFKDGKGDIVKELAESCKKYGMKLGIYLSPADLFQIESPDGHYGNLSEKTKRTIPRQVEGRPFDNKTTFEFVVDDYNEYFLNQLFELLTEYGPISEIWLDGAHPKRKGGQTYNYPAWKELVHTLAPEAVIFGREDVRWCGNEGGGTRDVEWNVVAYDWNPDTATVFPDMTDLDLGSREKLVPGKYLHYQPAETNTSIREGWFYRDDEFQNVRTADDVFDIYERSVGGNSIFLLNIPPNREGRFSPADVASLTETGRRIRETYGTDLLAGADGPEEVLDGDKNTFLLMDDGEEFTVTLPEPAAINRIMIQEAVSTHGERVEKHDVDAWIDGEWKEIASAENIGYKRILRFPDVTTDKIRFRLIASRKTPAISHISAHYYKATPPTLTFIRDDDGVVTFVPALQKFRWNYNGQNAAENLSAGYKVYYTTDGTEPTENSAEYTEPVKLPAGVVKAIAVKNGETGPVMNGRLGLVKNSMKVLSDGNNGTLTLELGDKSEIVGFAYNPRPLRRGISSVKGSVNVSIDGKSWTKVEDFELGNLVNDPSVRYQYFKNPVEAKFVKISIAGKGEGLIDLNRVEIL